MMNSLRCLALKARTSHWTSRADWTTGATRTARAGAGAGAGAGARADSPGDAGADTDTGAAADTVWWGAQSTPRCLRHRLWPRLRQPYGEPGLDGLPGPHHRPGHSGGRLRGEGGRGGQVWHCRHRLEEGQRRHCCHGGGEHSLHRRHQGGRAGRLLQRAAVNLLLLLQPQAVQLRVPGEPGQGLPASSVVLRLV